MYGLPSVTIMRTANGFIVEQLMGDEYSDCTKEQRTQVFHSLEAAITEVVAVLAGSLCIEVTLNDKNEV